MSANHLPVAPGPNHEELKQRILAEFLENPFQDDDIQGLSLRLGAARMELSDALSELCQARFLKPAGRRGHMLGLEFEAPDSHESTALPGNPPAPEALDLPGEVLVEQQASPSERLDLSLEELVDSLPFGVILLNPGGTLELANEQAAFWLGIPLEKLDGASFARITGFDPGQMTAHASSVSFSLQEPCALEISVHSCCLASAPAILIVMQDISLQEEVSTALAHFQEDLFARLRQEMMGPLMMMRQFLENLDPAEVGQARAALEQINWSLQDAMLTAKDETT